jgi:hypothetical protein
VARALQQRRAPSRAVPHQPPPPWPLPAPPASTRLPCRRLQQRPLLHGRGVGVQAHDHPHALTVQPRARAACLPHVPHVQGGPRAAQAGAAGSSCTSRRPAWALCRWAPGQRAPPLPICSRPAASTCSSATTSPRPPPAGAAAPPLACCSTSHSRPLRRPRASSRCRWVGVLLSVLLRGFARWATYWQRAGLHTAAASAATASTPA